MTVLQITLEVATQRTDILLHPIKGSRKPPARVTHTAITHRPHRDLHTQDSFQASLVTTSQGRINNTPTPLPKILASSLLVCSPNSSTTPSRSIRPIKINMDLVALRAILCPMEATIHLSIRRIAKMPIHPLDSRNTLATKTMPHSHLTNSLSRTIHRPLSQEALAVHCIHPPPSQVGLRSLLNQTHISLPQQAHITPETLRLPRPAHSPTVALLTRLRHKHLLLNKMPPKLTPVTALKTSALHQHPYSHRHWQTNLVKASQK